MDGLDKQEKALQYSKQALEAISEGKVNQEVPINRGQSSQQMAAEAEDLFSAHGKDERLVRRIFVRQ